MNTQQIIAAIIAVLAAVEGGKPLNSVANDVQDAANLIDVLAKSGVNIAPNVLKIVQSTSAGEANLEAGQAAVVGTVGAQFNGQDDKVVILAVRQSSDLAKQLLGL